MFEKIIGYSLANKLMVFVGVIALTGAGLYALSGLAVDAVPDITNNQVQIVTTSPTLAAQEVEQYVTFPIEAAMANIPDVTEVRSISRYGLSVVTVVFKDQVDLMRARQFVAEQIKLVSGDIPPELGSPEMMPITTGLGEIYQYVLTVKPGYEKQFDIMELRTIQDWIVKRQLTGIPGIIEVSSFGGLVKQYEVAINPELMLSRNVTINDVKAALERNNANSGGSYIEQGANAFYIRTEGRAENFDDIRNIIIEVQNGFPVRVMDVATVGYGSPKRYGAMTMDGKGEVVGGITLMLKGGNSSQAITNVKERMKQVQRALPEGVEIYPYLDRSVLVGKTIGTVTKNLIEGGLIVIFVLVLMLGNLRAGFVVASVIPLAMLFAIIMMRIFGVSANLMSLGAIDFGIVVDGAVIIVEGVLHYLHKHHKGMTLSRDQMDKAIGTAAGQIYRSAAFGVLIILVVFVPVFTLEGVEGKTFLPMAQTVSFAILGSLLLSITYVPVMSSILLKRKVTDKENFADRMMHRVTDFYVPVLRTALKRPLAIISATIFLFLFSIFLFTRMGAEFVPTLEEGDLAMQMSIPPGSSLSQSIATSTAIEKILKDEFPEVNHVVSKIGTAEVPTDPMAIEDADIMILLKEREEWTSANSREELIAKMKDALADVPNVSLEFTQPIQLRFNELMTGAKTDIAIKIFGEDVVELKHQADHAATIIREVQGAGDVKVEQTAGLRQLTVRMNRQQMAMFGINVEDVNTAIRAAYAGEVAGSVYENERRFDLVLRHAPAYRENLNLNRVFVHSADGKHIPLSQVASVVPSEGPMMISREDAKRRISIGVNVRDRDVASLVGEIEQRLNAELALPPGYSITYGGQFENLQHATARLMIAVPVALLLILFLLYLAFHSVREALIIFAAVPLAAVGGILALELRGMPFSISGGIGFIALFGVAVLNGLVLVNEFIRLRGSDGLDLKGLIEEGARARLRPVLTTALVASLGFLPMAISTTNGAEVQRPLATVVIGGLVTSTLLTLVVLPAIYFLVEKRRFIRLKGAAVVSLLLLFFGFTIPAQAQESLGLNELVQSARTNRVEVISAGLQQQHWQQERKMAYVLPDLSLNMQYGQINYEKADYNATVHQDLGKPWTAGTHRRWAEAGEAQAVRQAELAAHDVAFQVRSAYYHWLFAKAALAEMDFILAELKQLTAAAEMQRTHGEISNLDHQNIRSLIIGFRELEQNYRALNQSAEQTLRYWSGIGPEKVIRDTVFHRLPLLAVNDSLSPVFLAVYAQELAQRELARKMTAQEALPSIGVGYFNQSLNHVNNFQGAQASLSIPLFPSGRKQRMQQQHIATEQLQAEMTDRDRALRTELQQTADAYRANDALFNEMGADHAGQMRTARQQLIEQFTEGLISPFEFAQQAEMLVRSGLRHLETIDRHDQLVLKLNYLTSND